MSFPVRTYLDSENYPKEYKIGFYAYETVSFGNYNGYYALEVEKHKFSGPKFRKRTEKPVAYFR